MKPRSSAPSRTASWSSNLPSRRARRSPRKAHTGTHTGPLTGPRGEIPPTNRPLDLEFSDLFETDGDRITRQRIYYDQVQFMSQLGLMAQWRFAMFTIQQRVTQ